MHMGVEAAAEVEIQCQRITHSLIGVGMDKPIATSFGRGPGGELREILSLPCVKL